MSYGRLIQESEDRMRNLIADEVQALEACIMELEQTDGDLNATFDLRWKADMRAIKRWQ